jgi:polysaccharide biosynthesis transport protein
MRAHTDYLRWVRHWAWLVLLAALAGGVIAFGVAKRTPPTYQATTTLLVNASSSPSALTYNDVLLSQQLTLTYSKIAVEEPVLSQVIHDGHLSFDLTHLRKMVSAAPVLQTQLITITVKSGQAQQAAGIANLIATTFIAQQRDRMAKGDAANAVSVVEAASPPISPVSPNVKLDAILGIVVGLLAAIGLISLITYLDDTIKSHEDVDKVLQLPVLGLVQRNAAQAKLRLENGGIVQDRHAAEVFRIVRANLDFATAAYRSKVLLVTSTQKGEGKTTTTAKLAVALAETGKRVVLVDADLRLPTLHRPFQLENHEGLTSLLVDRVSLPESIDRFLRATPLPTLQVLTSGPLPPNPTELLQSQSMMLLLERLAEQYDVVLLDSPPVLAVADAMTVAPKAQGVIFVVESGHVRLGQINEALGRLRRGGTPVLGVVLNKVKDDTAGYYYYAYDGSYAGYTKAGTEHVNGTIKVVEEGAAPVVAGKGRGRR